MTPEFWRQLEELYQAARALLPSERSALLDRADPEVRAPVAAMLAQEDIPANGAFLDRPAWEGRDSLLKAESPVIVGQQLGPYQIEQIIGHGGMGEVFRATDPRLHRTVAIKTSFMQFTERFEREARVIAALNHPHIATVYDVGSSPSGFGYLVLEYVEGLTLEDLIAKGPVDPREARRIALQTAEAIEAAHEKGIVHRDLKPANIKLGEGGTVKVLDFGLAKVMDEVQTIPPREITNKGIILGTASYMSPEQALGGPIDRRSDIWSFGALVGEMLSGKRLFLGATTSDVLASVVRGEPDLSGVPAEWIPLIRRCLTKDVRRRLQSIGEARVMLEDGLPVPAPVAPVSVRARKKWTVATAALALVSLGTVAWTVLRNRPATPLAALNVSLLPPPETSFRFAVNGEGGFALSPDGTMLAFVGRTAGKAQLWVRPLAESESRLLPGSEGAYSPFWSPDSRWVAFFTPQKLKKIEVANGAAIDLCDVPANTSKGSWSPRGVILWGRTGNGRFIARIPEAGGSPVPVPGTANGWFPQFLPDGRRFVYTLGGTLGRGRDLWLASLDPDENDPDEKPRRIGESGRQPSYSAGHILSVVNGILMARPFDAARGELTGESFPLKAPLARRVFFGYLLAEFSANTQGMLVYPPQTNSLMELRWRDRTGRQLGSLGAPGEYYTPRISPDGRQVAFSRRDGDNSDIWVANLEANSFTRLTFDPAIDENPVWSPDGAAVTFENDASGNANLYRKAATGAGAIDRLTTDTVEEQPLDWSRNGRFLLYTRLTASTEIMIQAASGGRPLSFLGHARGASKAQFNPGVPRWIAYDFDGGGRREIYVQAFEPGKPASPACWQISNGGGTMPRWRGDGKEIFYLSLDGKMMAVRVSGDGAAFQSSTPQFLFNATPPQLRTSNWEYDVSADGERFLMIEPMAAPEYQPLTLVSNWRSR